jgi:hypothetical protein
LIEFGLLVLKKKIFKKISVYFCYYLPLEMADRHHMNKIESPLPKDASYQVWLKLACGSGEEVENVNV